ncbi:MAG TPA: ChbG/HpnK family deacetylase [Acidimicrobiales bacterium]
METPRLLIVNADDYGLTTGVSLAVLRAHRDGILTSTSVLAVAPAFEPTVGWLRDCEGIGVGAHLAAVGEDPPLLSAREIPTLVDKKGQLPMSWRQFLPRMAARRIDPEDLRREFTAQLDCLQAAGLTLTHVDTHQHLHLWPGVAAVVLDLAAQYDIGAMRLTRSAAGSPVGRVVRRLSNRLERQATTRGMRFTAVATGLDEAGTLDQVRMVAAVDRLAATGAATAELGTHPGEADDPERDRYRWGYLWPDELEALVAADVRSQVERQGFVLGTYADLLAEVGHG